MHEWCADFGGGPQHPTPETATGGVSRAVNATPSTGCPSAEDETRDFLNRRRFEPNIKIVYFVSLLKTLIQSLTGLTVVKVGF